MDPDLMPADEREARAHIVVGAGPPRTRAGQLMHEQWHSGAMCCMEIPAATCGSMGCGFLGRILAIEAERYEIVIADQSENDE